MRDLVLRQPVVCDLQRQIGCEDLLEWIEAEAMRLARLGSQGGPVRFTEELLKSRGIRRVIRDSSGHMSDEAAIEFEGSAYLIRYAAPLRSTRIRFSLAHEIGHTFLADRRGRPISALQYGTDPTVESVCDFFARALLMPRDKLIARLEWLSPGKRSVPPLHLVPRLATEFDVSEQAAARRLVFDLFPDFIAVICITNRDPHAFRWRTTWCASAGGDDLPRSSGWRIPLDTNGRKIPEKMVPDVESGIAVPVAVDGRWRDSCRPKTLAESRVPLSELAVSSQCRAVVARVLLDRGLFDEPLRKCFLALYDGAIGAT